MSSLCGRSLWTAYDHLGGLLLLNLIWTGLNLPWLLLAVLLLGLGAGWGGMWFAAAALLALELALLAPPTLLLFQAGNRWARAEEAPFGELLREWKRFALRAQGLGLLVVGTTLVLLVNIFFYRQFAGWLGLALSGMMLWGLLGVAMIAQYLFSVLVTQDGGIKETVRNSFLLALDNIRLSLALLLVTAVVLALGAITGLGLFCGLLAFLALFISTCFNDLLARYLGRPEPEVPRRSWRELIRPWDY